MCVGGCGRSIMPRNKMKVAADPALRSSHPTVMDMLLDKKPLALVEGQHTTHPTDEEGSASADNCVSKGTDVVTDGQDSNTQREPLASLESCNSTSPLAAPTSRKRSSPAEVWLASGLNELYLKRTRSSKSSDLSTPVGTVGVDEKHTTTD